MGEVIGAILIGAAAFGILRARRVVRETWDVAPRRWTFSVAAAAIAVLFLISFAGLLVGEIVAGLVLGSVLYVAWRRRRV